MIPFKDSPIVLAKEIVLETYPEYNRDLYDGIYEDHLNKLYEFETKYKDGTIVKDNCRNTYPDYRCALQNMKDKYSNWEDVESIKFFLDLRKVSLKTDAEYLNPEIIFKDHNAYFGNKVIISNVDMINITLPEKTELYILEIVYGKIGEEKQRAKWKIIDSPNPILKNKIITTPVVDLNKL